MSKLWGSRFKKSSDQLADKFSYSIAYDYRLARYDCLGGIAHAQMLGRQGIISQKDATKIVVGLRKLLKRIDKGTFSFDPQSEDIHTNIQSALKRLIGPAADKLHTARSRNDLVVLDMKMYCKDELNEIIVLLNKLQKVLVRFAEQNKDIIIPSYTHLQSAQVVLLAHHLLAYVEMLERDKDRMYGAMKRMDNMPLGSCALSGTTLPTNRHFISKQLGFSNTTDNSIDAVSDRDFVIETLSCLAILGTHYSRIAEDLIIWATDEFDRIDIDDAYCTGSSIMPHKKNPDMLELIRGETSKLISNVNEILILMKGLPLTYNRDLQLDKPPLFESIEKIKDMTELMINIMATLKITAAQKDHIKNEVTSKESFYSVDIMEYLIQKGISYREAHDAVGKLFKNTSEKCISISALSVQQLKKYSSSFEEDMKKLLNPAISVKMKRSYGSTSPQSVQRQIRKWKKILNA